MKNRGLLNPFTERTRELFIWNYSCWQCWKSKPLTLHHIYKRISNSPLNACPICQDCHEKGDIHSAEKREKYLTKTIKFLKEQDYKMTKKDIEFLSKIQ